MNRSESAAKATKTRQKQRLAAQRESRRARTPQHVLAGLKRAQYRRKMRKALGYVPQLAVDAFRGFRDCLSGEPL